MSETQNDYSNLPVYSREILNNTQDNFFELGRLKGISETMLKAVLRPALGLMLVGLVTYFFADNLGLNPNLQGKLEALCFGVSAGSVGLGIIAEIIARRLTGGNE